MLAGRPLRVTFALLILLFGGLRFFRLGQKLYWADEVATSKNITGFDSKHLLIEGEQA
jgi:uncharacterized membrane protein